MLAEINTILKPPRSAKFNSVRDNSNKMRVKVIVRDIGTVLISAVKETWKPTA